MKILVIQLKMIGDVLTSSVLFEALRDKFPRAELHYLVYRHTMPVIKYNPFIDKVLAFRKEDKSVYLINAVREQDYDAVIDVQSIPLTATVTGLSGAKIRSAYEKWYTKLACNHVFSRNIEAETEAGAAIEKRLQLLSPLTTDYRKNIKPKIYLRKTEHSEAVSYLKENGIDPEQTIFMISVLGSSQLKTYPSIFMAKVLDKIAQNFDALLILNYIPAQEAEVTAIYNLCDEKTQQKTRRDIYGKNLREFLALTAQCNALIGNEGGAINMAKALNVPTFSIFSPELNKTNWNVFEDGKQNVSVHLKDYQPKLFEGKSRQELKTANLAMYREFNPEFFEKELIEFCKRHSSNEV